ncbi:MAG TPA: site-specific DNA-methyltransferase [Staphylococcus ureilyticus]|uniref:DNA-methyltransferase n=1 Tax=Staphylococcus ureilyticus TaxID=94138 RepID=UPI001D1B708F|nr:site-specific DNA-methyltransferase [Staphylococcus ureilyticus]HJG66171.1 site-specific DNA-methyltransferase [Staphylococcus ureilyticus]
MINLLKGDCLELLKTLENESVDALITDPPYNIARDNNFTSMGRAGIDFGDWDKGFNLISWLPIAIEKLKKGGNIIIFTSWKNTTPIIKELEKNNCEAKDMIRVEKSNPMPRNRDRRFVTDYEIAIWAVKKGAKWTFNRQLETYERPLIKTKVTPKSEKIEKGHPTQKNIETMEWLIERLTDEGDIVLDPFMGSGTTGVACQKLDRDFIGCELSDEYFEMAQKRLQYGLN